MPPHNFAHGPSDISDLCIELRTLRLGLKIALSLKCNTIPTLRCYSCVFPTIFLALLSRLHLGPTTFVVLVQFLIIPIRIFLNDLNHQMWAGYLLLCQSNELPWSIWHIVVWRLHTSYYASSPMLLLSLTSMRFHFARLNFHLS
jgi:hypothetical protein